MASRDDKVRRTVLVVEDSWVVREQLRRALEGGGYLIDSARDAEDGLRSARNGTYAAIITDINMPGLDGLTMVTAIRALPGYARTPIFALTTESTPDMLERGRAAGVTAWIVKPFRADPLLKALARTLGGGAADADG